MPKKKTQKPNLEEQQAINDSEVMAESPTLAEEASSNVDEEAEKGALVEGGAEIDATVPMEVESISTATKTARDLNKKVTKATNKATKKEKKSRSAQYVKNTEFVERGKLYELTEAIETIKKASYSKFDGSVELHLRLNKKKSKGSTESSKGFVNLPHGTGKEKKIIVLDEAKIEQIAKTKKIDFDVAIASPALMPKIGKIAKILGPKGKMPDPKAGTVTDNPEAVIKEIQSGKVEFRIDSTDNIHQIIGKVSWETSKLQENIKVMLALYPKSRYASAYLTASMAPSVQLSLDSIK